MVSCIPIVAIGNPERHVRKASHRGSKQQQRSCSQSLLLLFARATYMMVLFFTHILFVVNHTINATPPERLQHHEDMTVNKFSLPTTKHFIKGESVTFSKGLLMTNAEKCCEKIKKWGRCQLAVAQLLRVASLVFPTFSVFKLLYHEHSFAFFPSAT